MNDKFSLAQCYVYTTNAPLLNYCLGTHPFPWHILALVFLQLCILDSNHKVLSKTTSHFEMEQVYQLLENMKKCQEVDVFITKTQAPCSQVKPSTAIIMIEQHHK